MSQTVSFTTMHKGEDIVFPVTAVLDNDVSDLKEYIQNKRALGGLKGVDPHTLELWKVSAINKPLCEMTLLFLAQGPYNRRARPQSL